MLFIITCKTYFITVPSIKKSKLYTRTNGSVFKYCLKLVDYLAGLVVGASDGLLLLGTLVGDSDGS